MHEPKKTECYVGRAKVRTSQRSWVLRHGQGRRLGSIKAKDAGNMVKRAIQLAEQAASRKS